ncbi:cytochrome P450 [Aspergillus taichungensis]|uniref:Cytochrome P450 n=1 Tax=Aspergillus taichungensis TaxID=482145 RepID=A0A2J5I5W6_9EURO|nr:cytochrome P450 [Aspergillus taichungensis]
MIFAASFQTDPWTLVITTIAAYTVYCVVEVIHRVYFHPLARFSGPWKAKISEGWFSDIAPSGFAERTLAVQHDRYKTTALRVAPNQLHITDPDAYKVIYNQTAPFPKDADYYATYNTPHSLFTECDPVLHRELRKRLSPMFSRVGVTKLEPIIHEKLRLMTEKITRLSKNGPIEMNYALRGLTVDIISEFAFGESRNVMQSSETSFAARFLSAFDESIDLPIKNYYGGFLRRRLSRIIPLSVIAKIDPTAAVLHEIFVFAESCARAYSAQAAVADGATKHSKPHPIVFDALQGLPEWRTRYESMDMIVAGSDTTAWTLTTVLFHVLRREGVKSRVEEAAKRALPDLNHIPSYVELEKDEYLFACVKEALRLGTPVPGVLPRIVPSGTPFQVEGKIVPPGTIVGMSAYTMHLSTSVWGPDASVFNPDRWLQPGAKDMDQYFVPFSKGTRSCIGMNLAYAEVIIVMTYLFRMFDMKLVSKEPRVREMFIQMPDLPCCLVEFTPRDIDA